MIGRSRCDFTFAKLESFLLTHGQAVWWLANNWDWLGRKVNRLLIDRAVKKTRNRPHPLSTLADYTSWESLTDRSYFGRHLPPKDWPHLPDAQQVAELFRRPAAGGKLSEKSTTLFPSFAQWFTDGFLITDFKDRRRTQTNHEIDLCPLYGLKKPVTDCLRTMSDQPGERGRLKSQIIDGEEFPPFLYDETGTKKSEFAILPEPMLMDPDWPASKKATLFATGGDRVNTTPQTAMFNVLFLREHNRLAAALEKAHPNWDDERIFQTARNTVIVLLIKLVVEEYINHISPYHFRFRADPSAVWKATWNRTNWITVEFNLLYRWHSLVPDAVDWADGTVPMQHWLRDNSPLMRAGLEAAFAATSRQPAGAIGLRNTPSFLVFTEALSIQQGRQTRLASYNDYRAAMNFPRVTRWDEITGDAALATDLARLYPSVDDLEFYVGLFAEDSRPNAAVPALIGRMVAIDAFSQALTNPLLSHHVFHRETFDLIGWEAIHETKNFADVVRRNVPKPTAGIRISMNRKST